MTNMEKKIRDLRALRSAILACFFLAKKKITFVFFFIFECTTSKFIFQKEATEMKLNTIIFVHCLKNVKTLWLFRLTKARDNIEI